MIVRKRVYRNLTGAAKEISQLNPSPATIRRTHGTHYPG